MQPTPTLDDPRISLSVSEDQVVILFEPEDRDLLEDEQGEQDALGNNLGDLPISSRFEHHFGVAVWLAGHCGHGCTSGITASSANTAPAAGCWPPRIAWRPG